MDSRDGVIMGAVALAGVFLISHGYLRAMWNAIYNSTHGPSSLTSAQAAAAAKAAGQTTMTVQGKTVIVSG